MIYDDLFFKSLSEFKLKQKTDFKINLKQNFYIHFRFPGLKEIF